MLVLLLFSSSSFFDLVHSDAIRPGDETKAGEVPGRVRLVAEPLLVLVTESEAREPLGDRLAKEEGLEEDGIEFLVGSEASAKPEEDLAALRTVFQSAWEGGNGVVQNAGRVETVLRGCRGIAS